MAAENNHEQEEAEMAAQEEDMETSDTGERNAERFQSTYHSSEMALAFERLVRFNLTKPESCRLVI